MLSTEAGTGIVHLAPTYGEEDFELAKKENFRLFMSSMRTVIILKVTGKVENVWEINKTDC